MARHPTRHSVKVGQVRDHSNAAGVKKDVHVLALIPSTGHGGGIEAYVDNFFLHAQMCGIVNHRCVLTGRDGHLPPRLSRKILFAFRTVRRALRLRLADAAVILVFLPSFAGLGLLARLLAGRSKPEVIVYFYGSEIWSAGWPARWLWRRGHVKMVAVSSFSAGALARFGAAQILPPGIPSARYEKLLAIPPKAPESIRMLEVLSVFRLPEAQLKGGFVLLGAVAALRTEGFDIGVTFAGFGSPPPEFVAAVSEHAPWARLVTSPRDDELIGLYAESDLFVLATRLRSHPVPSGEGFGIVLTEAALAGTAVIAPACGGSADAFVDGVTGLKPRDESSGALVDALRWCLVNPVQVRRLATNGRVWARERFRPEAYGRRVAQLLLGHGFHEECDLAFVTPGAPPGEPRRPEDG